MHAWVKDATWARIPGLDSSPGAAFSKPESLWTDAAALSALHGEQRASQTCYKMNNRPLQNQWWFVHKFSVHSVS